MLSEPGSPSTRMCCAIGAAWLGEPRWPSPGRPLQSRVAVCITGLQGKVPAGRASTQVTLTAPGSPLAWSFFRPDQVSVLDNYLYDDGCEPCGNDTFNREPAIVKFFSPYTGECCCT